MKKYLYIFLAISLAVGFASCSSDDNLEYRKYKLYASYFIFKKSNI